MLAALRAAIECFTLDVNTRQCEARDAYLAQARTLAELERRQRKWARSRARQSPRLPLPYP